VAEQLTAVNGKLIWGEPKTRAGRRAVSISAFLSDQLEEQLAERSLPGPDDLVFPNGAGNPMSAPSFTNNILAPARRRAGLTGVRFHDLRHTAVALAIAEGAHPKAIQVRMGHSSSQVTLDRYGHLFPALDEQIASGLDAVYQRAAEQRQALASIAPLRRKRESEAIRGRVVGSRAPE
jgi:integrase